MIYRGEYGYSLTESWTSKTDAQISVRDSQGCEHTIVTMALNPGDWEKIEAGQDPVKDGWEDGWGNSVAVAVDLDILINKVKDILQKTDIEMPPYVVIRDAILEANDYVSYGAEWNGLSDDYDANVIAESIAATMQPNGRD